MYYYLTAAGLVLHTIFWGAGLAWLILPRRWKQCSWIFAPGMGAALQSVLVWLGARTPLAGTDAYGWWIELIPAALLAVAVRRDGRMLLGSVRRSVRSIALLAVLGAAGAWLLLSPHATAFRSLTSASLGSCDHADYAAGARVFKEFSKDDRIGFLGLAEVTRVHSADYFFDYWIRLNHFTPAALIAHNGTIFGLQPHQLVSVNAAVLLLLNLPIVVFLGRIATGLRGLAIVVVAALYAVSPLGAYAVHHGALGQMLAAQGIAILTSVLIIMGREAAAGRACWQWTPILIGAFWLLAGSYNFIITVCLAPAAVWLVLYSFSRGDLRPLARVAAAMAAALGGSVILFWERFAGLSERFSLFEEYSFGWPVPVLSPEGWLGLVASSDLWSWPTWMRVFASGAILSAVAFALWKLWPRHRVQVIGALALIVPTVLGWAILAFETRNRANASYDAFKLLSVFYPGLLAGMCVWLRIGDAAGNGSSRAADRARWLVIGGLAGGLLAGNLFAAERFRQRMTRPPLFVDQALVEVGKLEAEGKVGSLNMMIGDFWTRLWANALLLRKEQYFASHTYEARLNTSLKGDWNLQRGLLKGLPASEGDVIRINDKFVAIRRGSAGALQFQFGDGWHAAERIGSEQWRWAEDDGTIVVNNPGRRPTRARLLLDVRGVDERELVFRAVEAGEEVRFELGEDKRRFETDEIIFPPGRTTLSLATSKPAVTPRGGDRRRLSFALYGLESRAVGRTN